MTTNTEIPRPLGALKLPRKISDLINIAHVIVIAMTDNPNFPNPQPTVAAMTTGLNELVTAEAGAKLRTVGAVALRNAKKRALVTLLEEWRTYVQSTADANPDNAPHIIQSSGVMLRKTPQRQFLGFHAKLGTAPGSVKVVAPAAARRASYDWQYSIDGGKTWVDLLHTLQSKTTVTGLPAMTTVQVRYYATVKTGRTEWSQPISILVM
jgi:hypothetical protein